MKRQPKVTLGEGSGRQRHPEPSLRIAYVFSVRTKFGARPERLTTGAYNPQGVTNGPTSPEGRSGRPPRSDNRRSLLERARGANGAPNPL